MQRPPISPQRRGIPLGDPGRASKSEGSPLASLHPDSLARPKDERGMFPGIKRTSSPSPQKGAQGGFPLKMRGRSPAPADSLDSPLQRDALDVGRASPDEQERLLISRLVRQSPSRASESIASGHGGPYLTKGPRSHPELPHATLPPVVPYSPFLGPNPLLSVKPPISRVPLGSTAASDLARGGSTESAWGRTNSGAWHGTGRVAEGEPPALVQEVQLSEAEDPWVALEKLRRRPESAQFVYMLPYRKSELSPLNPYHVRVVPHTDVKGKTHLTLSIKGVTHTSAEGLQLDFTNIERWKRECYVFSFIIRIPIFATYSRWKPFKKWRTTVRRNKFDKALRSMRQKFVGNSETRVNTLLRLRATCLELEKVMLFVNGGPSASPISLDDFSSTQQRRRTEILDDLDRSIVEAAGYVRAACAYEESQFETLFAERGAPAADPLARFGDIDRSVIIGQKAPSSLARASLALPPPPPSTRRRLSTTDAEVSGEGSEEEGDSLWEAGLDPGVPFSMQAGRCRVHRRSASFVRLCDYMLFHALHLMVLDSTLALTVLLERAGGGQEGGRSRDNSPARAPVEVAPHEDASPDVAGARVAKDGTGGAGARGQHSPLRGVKQGVVAGPLLLATARVNQGQGGAEAQGLETMAKEAELAVQPPRMQVRTEMLGIATSFVMTASSARRMLDDPGISKVLSLSGLPPPSNLGEFLVTTIVHDQPYKDLLGRILEACNVSQRLVDLRLTEIAPCLEAVKRYRHNFSAETLEKRAWAEKIPFEELLRIAQTFDAEQAAVDALPNHISCRVLQVHFEGIKAQLGPPPTEGAKAVRAMVPRLLGRLQTDLLDEVMRANTVLQQTPETLDAFVEWMAALLKIDEAQEKLEDSMADFEARQTVMDNADPPITMTAEEQAGGAVLRPAWQQLLNTLPEVLDHRRSLKTKWAVVLDKEVVQFILDVDDIRLLCEDEMLLARSENTAPYISTFQDLVEQVSYLQECLARLEHHLGALGKPTDGLPRLDDLSEDTQLRHQVWEALGELDEVEGSAAASSPRFSHRRGSTVQAGDVSKRATGGNSWPFMTRTLDQLDFDVEQARAQRLMKLAAQANRRLPPHAGAVAELAPRARAFSDLIKGCQHLINPAMRPRHWTHIEEIAAVTLPGGQVAGGAGTRSSLGSALGGTGGVAPRTTSNVAARTTVNVARASVVASSATNASRAANWTVQQVMDHGLIDPALPTVAATSLAASEEARLEEVMRVIRSRWGTVEIPIISFLPPSAAGKAVGGAGDYLLVLGDLSDLQVMLDESLTTMSSVRSSRFSGGVRGEVDKLHGTLLLLQETVDLWGKLQETWMQLEPVMASSDVAKFIPAEAKMFAYVDREFRLTMRKFADNPKCLRIGAIPGQKEACIQLNETADRVRRALDSYLDAKRRGFPRFFFLTNEQLLSLMARPRSPGAVIPLLPAMFAGISKLRMSGEPIGGANESLAQSASATADIVGLESPEGEYVPIGRGLKPRGELVDWLGEMEKRLLEALRGMCRDAVLELQGGGGAGFFIANPAQPAMLASQVAFCARVEAVLEGMAAAAAKPRLIPGAMPALAKKKSTMRRLSDASNNPAPLLREASEQSSYNLTRNMSMREPVREDRMEQLLEMQESEVEALVDVLRLSLGPAGGPLGRRKLTAAVRTAVEERQVVEELLAAGTASPGDFEWQARMRHAWDFSMASIRSTVGKDVPLTCQVRHLGTSTPYGFEYQGVAAGAGLGWGGG
ncbi:dynein heavy chain, N-terminal region 2-domain-containing protein, partial [Baffinella frigidus]